MTHGITLNTFRESPYSDRPGACGWTRAIIPRENVAADGGQTHKNGFPLVKIQLPKIRPQALDECIIQQGFAGGVGDEKAVQAYAKCFGKFLHGSEAGCHLTAFDT